jgi:hypothetical protein
MHAAKKYSLLQLLNNVKFVPISPILVTLIMESIRSSGTPVLTRATRRNIPEEGFLHFYRRENLKSHMALCDWALQWRCNVFPQRY